MASQTAIDAIKVELPDEEILTELGIDDTILGVLIDSGLSTTKVMLSAWRAIAAKSLSISDVSEAGSSRPMPVFDRAKQMIDFWQTRSDAEDTQAGTIPVRTRGASHKGIRV